MRKDEFETDLDDQQCNDDTNVGFDVNVCDEIENGREEDGDRDPGIVHGLSSGGGKHGGMF